jgi:thiol-disulfide isomerase/thioredoxin
MRTLLAALLLFGLTACSRGDDKKAEKKEPEKKTLTVGDPAPALKAGTWLNGSEVKGYEAGKVYVVDFWAIWCGPCIQVMPHLSELQSEYKDKGLVVVAATTIDQRNPLAQVKMFVQKRGPKLGFPFAADESDYLEKEYMEAAKRDTLPSTFVVDKAGKVAFIGHPMQLDDVLPKVLAGTWKGEADVKAMEAVDQELDKVYTKFEKDPESGLKELAAFEAKHPEKTGQPMFQMTKVAMLVQAKKFDDAKSATEAILSKLAEKKSTTVLNNLRLVWSSKELNPDKKHVDLAVKAAEAMLKAEGEKDPMGLFAVAEAHNAAGDKAKAVEFAEKAVQNAEDDDQKSFLKEQLERYKK